MVGPRSMLGSSAIVKITSVGRWSVFGEVIEVLTQNNRDRNKAKGSPCTNSHENCACSKEPESCACASTSCCQTQNTVPKNDSRQVDKQNANLIGWLLRKRKNHLHRKEAETVLQESNNIQGLSPGHATTTLSSGIIFGLLTLIALLFLGFMNLSSN